MKSKIYSILLIVIMSMSSCNDFLDQTSDSEFTDKDAFSTPAYTEYAISGIYSIMTWDEMYSSRLSLMYSENTDIEIVGASDKNYNEQGNRGISNYYAEPTWAGYLNRTWSALYSGIERANLAIEQIPLSPAYGNSETERAMKSYLGEALSLRALYYFELVRHFGDVPFKTQPTLPDASNFYPPVTDRDTIMDHLLEDLRLASEYMDWGTTPECMSRGFSLGLMARIALWRGGYSIRNKPGYPTERGDNYLYYYQIANDACRRIIEEGPHSLNPSYVQIFRNLCQLHTETSYFENIFEVAMGLSRSSEIGYSIGVRFRTNPKYGFGNNSNVVSTTPYYFY
ncbi:MAG: RagB/SusD family nutrient uptake outer membrane protein [Odoribacter sp.]|nr:RagB/SusD family nutrient uptake outer membrane protein [Odoribacter sp.]